MAPEYDAVRQYWRGYRHGLLTMGLLCVGVVLLLSGCHAPTAPCTPAHPNYWADSTAAVPGVPQLIVYGCNPRQRVRLQP